MFAFTPSRVCRVNGVAQILFQEFFGVCVAIFMPVPFNSFTCCSCITEECKLVFVCVFCELYVCLTCVDLEP